MTILLADIKNSLKVDYDDDDGLLTRYLAAATAFITSAVGEDDANNDFYSQSNVQPLFETAVMSLVGTYYTYRASVSNLGAIPVDLTMSSIIGQLRGLYDTWTIANEAANG
ncbi:MAG: head-tail connector protein [Oenococcus sp.]|uniref:head-tail connector protein n=1 Tax=Oenococcus sp. TaxID=1979414 RepID=UPI0039E89100